MAMRVVVRFRPADGAASTITAGHAKEASSASTVYGHDTSQSTLIHDVLERHLSKAIAGPHSCVFLSYGQTGSGKTHTMFGPPAALTAAEVGAAGGGGSAPSTIPSSWGLLPFAAATAVLAGPELLVELSAVEVYLERVCDLLNDRKRVAPPGSSVRATSLRPDNATTHFNEQGKWVKPRLSSERQNPDAQTAERRVLVRSIDDVVAVTREIEATRAAAQHKMNTRSSRSHCIVTLSIKRVVGGNVAESQLQFVDLAGSERVGKSGVVEDSSGHATAFHLTGGVTVDLQGTRMDEARSVNLSLSALGRVINAIASGSAHVNFRDSSLTQMLKPALTMTGAVCVLLALRSESTNDSETQSTLRFGKVCAAAAKGRRRAASTATRGMTSSGSRTCASSSTPIADLRREVDQRIAKLQADVNRFKADGLDEHVNPGFDAPTVKGFLENKRRFEAAKAKVTTAKERIAEQRAAIRIAAAGPTLSTPALRAAERELELAKQEEVVFAGLFYRQVTTGIWTQRDKRLSDAITDLERLQRTAAFLRPANS